MFEDFWAAYPRKKAKGHARKAWERAVRHTDPLVIIDGAKRYAEEKRTEDPMFVKHPATWLNGECWEDEPDVKHAEGEDRLRRHFEGMENVVRLK